MKNIMKWIIITSIILVFITTISMASTNVVPSVSITDIEAPYSENRVLDTEGKVPSGANYRIVEIGWKEPHESLSGYYEVTVTLEASIGYTFSEDVTARINGGNVISKTLLEENKELKIVYAFNESASTSSTIGNSTSTLRYRISVYCNKEKGAITPTVVRALKGSDQTFKITPNEGYKIKDVLVDGESVGAVSEHTIKNIKKDHQIKAYFEEIENKVEDEEKVEIEEKEVKPLLKVLLAIIEAIIG